MVNNYGRFYAMLGKLVYDGDKEELKRQLVYQCSWGRTESLRDLTRTEYEALCQVLEQMCGRSWRASREAERAELRRHRSVCLSLMQRLGVDTTDWQRVNGFCLLPRIAGKEFARLGLEELGALAVKLRAILRKGGMKTNMSNVPRAMCVPCMTVSNS